MKTKIGLYFIGIILGIFLLVFGLDLLGIWKSSVTEPMKENVKREVFEETQSYIEGKRQELSKYRLEYMRTEDEIEKNAIQMTIQQSFANVKEEHFEGEMLRFLQAMKNGENYR
jgi:Sec-independent protein translocase protein TatA